MKNKWLKIWGLIIFITLIIYLLLQQLPTYKFFLPGRVMDFIWRITGISFILLLAGGLVYRRIKHRKVSSKLRLRWQIAVFSFAGILLLQSVLYLSFPLDYGIVKESLPSRTKLLFQGNIPVSDTDSRCTFSGQYRVIKYQNLYLLTNSTGIGDLKAYSNYYSQVEYFPDKSKAFAWGGSERMLLLDFHTCQKAVFPTNFTFNTAFFMQRLRSISPEGKFVVYEVYYGYLAPPFPGNEKNYSFADASKNGIWLYNLETKKNSQVRSLPVDSDTDNLNITWDAKQLTLTGINCPQSGCFFNLQRY